MAGAPGMHDGMSIRQFPHQFTGTAGVVEMNVGQENILNIADIPIQLLQGLEQKFHAVIRASIDKSGVSIFNHQVAGIEPRPGPYRQQ